MLTFAATLLSVHAKLKHITYVTQTEACNTIHANMNTGKHVLTIGLEVYDG